jgi:hypothetical protein
MLDAPMADPAVKLEVSDDHMANFFEAVKSRKDPICPVEGGHQSAIVGHLIVAALRSGKTLHWDAAKERFIGANAGDGNDHLSRKMRKPYDYGFAGWKT